YLMDTKVDLMYESFLSELLSEQHLPPNPYPRLLSLFRQAGMKMTLWGESNDQIKSKILHSGGKLVDAENYVYHLAGCDVYGLQTALTCIDVPNFQKVVIIAKQFVNTEFPQRKGQFKIAMVFAVSGWSPWYGQLMPYIIKLDLHEHCYFKGPIGCHGEAILIYIDIVREYLFRENDNGSVVVMGLYIGEHSRWSIEDIKKKSSGFELELSKAIEAKQAVYIKMYKAIGWRYLCIQKHLLFHYVDNTEDDYETFFPNNPVSLYQNTFFLHEK
ncbi:uncharacterized protein LOC100376560, partial [Saccoglossus kowalevskii]|uniref:Uncharacterized protein LOC100376560 n=1 Tax=Saccoglossus kowalevskii TaxID=10224 RepID=A0ABM0GL07_SACKO